MIKCGCGNEIHPERYELGYKICLSCGENSAKRSQKLFIYMTASFYKTVYQRKFEELPRWKKLAIVEDSERNNWSGLLTEFIKTVIEEAEKEYANSRSTVSNTPVEYVTESGNKSKKTIKKKN